MKRVIFMGTPDFAVPVLDTLVQSAYEVVLVVTQPDRPKGRKRTLTASPVKEAALRHGIPVFQPEKLKENYEEMFAYHADLIVTAAYGQLLPNALLEHPPYGSINVHASLLPELRGGAPIHSAIIEGKKETGITIMYMVEKLDAGAMIAQRAIPIEQDDHVGTMHDKLSTLGASLLMDTLPRIFAGDIKAEEQDEEKATFAANITREQEKINWQLPHVAVYNQIRGLHPWPVAYTLYEGERMKIWWAEMEESVYSDTPAGTIVAIGETSISVVCGNGKAVRLMKIQPAGKKRMEMKDFLRGNPDQFKRGQMLE